MLCLDSVVQVPGRGTFQAAEHVDRFGRPIAPGMHGAEEGTSEGAVGHAPRAAPIASPGKGVVSAFRSQMAGRADVSAAELEKKPPGPAFYSPQKQPAKTSFHMNARKTMVSRT